MIFEVLSQRMQNCAVGVHRSIIHVDASSPKLKCPTLKCKLTAAIGRASLNAHECGLKCECYITCS